MLGLTLMASRFLAVYARDRGLPPRQAKATVRVQVTDDNDHRPTFQSAVCSLEVPENQRGVELITLCATDPDAGENGRLSYQLTGDYFSRGEGGTLRWGVRLAGWDVAMEWRRRCKQSSLC